MRLPIRFCNTVGVRSFDWFVGRAIVPTIWMRHQELQWCSRHWKALPRTTHLFGRYRHRRCSRVKSRSPRKHPYSKVPKLRLRSWRNFSRRTTSLTHCRPRLRILSSPKAFLSPSTIPLCQILRSSNHHPSYWRKQKLSMLTADCLSLALMLKSMMI